MSLSRLKNRLLARLATRYPVLAQRFIDAYQPWETEGEIPWTQVVKPLREARLALVTTAGIHHAGQPPFNMSDKDGDPGFRELDGATLFDAFRITHDYYDHSDADRDPNVVLPLVPLQELVAEGVLGGLAETHYGFMGHIDGRHILTLIEVQAQEVARRLKQDRVDLVLLAPA